VDLIMVTEGRYLIMYLLIYMNKLNMMFNIAFIVENNHNEQHVR